MIQSWRTPRYSLCKTYSNVNEMLSEVLRSQRWCGWKICSMCKRWFKEKLGVFLGSCHSFLLHLFLAFDTGHEPGWDQLEYSCVRTKGVRAVLRSCSLLWYLLLVTDLLQRKREKSKSEGHFVSGETGEGATLIWSWTLLQKPVYPLLCVLAACGCSRRGFIAWSALRWEGWGPGRRFIV